jgi:hypothetical protein
MLMGSLAKAYYLTGMSQLFIVVTSARIKTINSGFLSLHFLTLKNLPDLSFIASVTSLGSRFRAFFLLFKKN